MHRWEGFGTCRGGGKGSAEVGHVEVGGLLGVVAHGASRGWDFGYVNKRKRKTLENEGSREGGRVYTLVAL